MSAQGPWRRQRWALLLPLLLLFLLSAVVAHPATSTTTTTTTTSSSSSSSTTPCTAGFLKCWLASLVIRLPDIHIDKNKVVADIDDLTCTGIQLSTIASSRAGPSSIAFAATGLGVPCTAKFDFDYDNLFKGSGTADVKLSPKTSFAMELELVSSSTSPPMATAARVTACSPSLDLDIKLHATLGWLIDILIDVFKPEIEKTIEAQLCAAVDGLVAKNVTALLQGIDGVLRPFSGPPPPYPPQPTPSLPPHHARVVQWSALPLFQAVDAVLNSFVNATGWRCLLGSLLPAAITVPIDKNVSVAVPALANLTLGLDYVQVSGVNSLSNLTLLHASPFQAETITNRVAFDAINVTLRASIQVVPDNAALQGNVLRETFDIVLGVDDVRLLVDVLAALERGLTLGQALQNVSCLLAETVALNLTTLDASVLLRRINLVPVSQAASGRTLETFVDALVNTFVDICTDEYALLLTRVIGGVVRGPVADAVNGAFAEAIRSATCSSTPILPPASAEAFFHWNESALVRNLSAFISSPALVNAALRCVSLAQVRSPTLNVSGLDSFTEFELARPTGFFSLSDRLGLGRVTAAADIDVHIQEVHTRLQLNATASNASLVAPLGDVKLDEDVLMRTSLGQLESWACMLAMLKSLNVTQLNATFRALEVGYLITGGGGELHLTDELRGHNFTQLVNGLLAQLEPLVLHFLDANIADQCAAAPGECSGAARRTTEGDHAEWWLWVLILMACATVGVFVLIYQRRIGAHDTKPGAGEASSTTMEKEGFELLLATEQADDVEASPLIQSERLPVWVRGGVFVAILGNIALFLSSNLSVGASMSVHIRVGDEYVRLSNLFHFTLANSVRDMWKAGVYPLSILIATFSGGWPYLKLLMMLVCWCVPPKRLSLKRREKLLIWLDRLGKWSLIDTYIMVMFMVAFYFHIILVKGVIEVKVLVVAEYGLYSFVVATMLSLALSHILLASHRHVQEPFLVQPGGERISLSRELRCTSLGRWFVAGTVLFAVALLGWGAYVTTFEFEFEGLISLLIESVREFSLLSLGQKANTAGGDTFGSRWLQAVFFGFAIGMPVVYLAVLLVLWLVPLTLQWQRIMLVLSEVSYAWAALEVFMLSIVAAVLEISQFAQFMVGDKCDGINAVLRVLLNTELHGDDRCFDLIATLKGGCWVLVASAVIVELVGLLLGDASEDAVGARLDQYFYGGRIRERKAVDDELEVDSGGDVGDDDEMIKEGGGGRRRGQEAGEESRVRRFLYALGCVLEPTYSSLLVYD